ncbi:TIGR00341 family protein [Methanocaldococcus sp. 10A]
MKLRFIECHIPKHLFMGIDEIREWDGVIWANVKTNGAISTIQILTTLKDSEKIVDKLKERYGGANYRIVVFEPTMTYPPIEEEEEKEKPERLIREELYSTVADIANLTKENILILILSTIVAIVGIYKDDVALLIASMIIAPLLGPNISLSFSITVADYKLAMSNNTYLETISKLNYPSADSYYRYINRADSTMFKEAYKSFVKDIFNNLKKKAIKNFTYR